MNQNRSYAQQPQQERQVSAHSLHAAAQALHNSISCFSHSFAQASQISAHKAQTFLQFSVSPRAHNRIHNAQISAQVTQVLRSLVYVYAHADDHRLLT